MFPILFDCLNSMLEKSVWTYVSSKSNLFYANLKPICIVILMNHEYIIIITNGKLITVWIIPFQTRHMPYLPYDELNTQTHRDD